MTIAPELLELLACPAPECRGGLALAGERLVCARCGRRYRVEMNWPVLIPEEAEGPPSAAPPAKERP
ncbi:MAG TPA: Trm112 family protein [Phycisphaerae bacterium]|nr:Trm112 family protein [Phycisphaerae bacterium]